MSIVATASQLTIEARELGYMTLGRPDDDTFLLPDPDWVDQFCRYLLDNRHTLWPRTIDLARPQKSDCDEIAEIALAEADKSIMLSQAAVDAGGAVFTTVIYIPMDSLLFDTYQGPANHMLLAIRTSVQWILLDPWTASYEAIKTLLARRAVGALLDLEL